MYLDDDLWSVLHARAAASKTSVSELVRQAVRERYAGNLEERREAMLAFIGIRGDRRDLTDSRDYVRALRRGSRTERIGRK